MEKLYCAVVIAMTALLLGCTKETDTPATEASAPPLQQAASRTATSSIIQWSSCYGFAADDAGFGVDSIPGGGYFIVGTVYNKSSGYVAKINSDNNTEWSISIGGNATDEPSAVVATPDGGCLVAGLTNSADLPGYSGSSDVLLAKISAGGAVQWIRAQGTSADERAKKLIRTTDGGFALVGYKNYELLVMKLYKAIESISTQEEANTQSLVEWQRSYTFEDNTSNLGYDIAEYAGHFYVTGSGYNSATNLNNTLYGKVSVLDGAPVFLKRLMIGSGVKPGFAITRNKTNDGFIIAGRDDCDAVVFSVDDLGNAALPKRYGGTGCGDIFTSIASTDNGYLIAGKTNSKSGDITGAKGGLDIWLLQVTADGTKIKSYNLGGSRDDEANGIVRVSANEYMVIGATQSTSGDVTGNKGGYDIWAVKVKLP